MIRCGHNSVQLHLAATVPFDMGNHRCTTKQHAYKLHKWSSMTMIQSYPAIYLRRKDRIGIPAASVDAEQYHIIIKARNTGLLSMWVLHPFWYKPTQKVLFSSKQYLFMGYDGLIHLTP